MSYEIQMVDVPCRDGEPAHKHGLIGPGCVWCSYRRGLHIRLDVVFEHSEGHPGVSDVDDIMAYASAFLEEVQRRWPTLAVEQIAVDYENATYLFLVPSTEGN